MSAAKVEISLDAGGHGKVIIDGKEIQNSVSGLHFRADHRGNPRLVLDLIPGSADIRASGAAVIIDGTARELLTALGWTPPGGD